MVAQKNSRTHKENCVCSCYKHLELYHSFSGQFCEATYFTYRRTYTGAQNIPNACTHVARTLLFEVNVMIRESNFIFTRIVGSVARRPQFIFVE